MGNTHWETPRLVEDRTKETIIKLPVCLNHDSYWNPLLSESSAQRTVPQCLFQLSWAEHNPSHHLSSMVEKIKVGWDIKNESTHSWQTASQMVPVIRASWHSCLGYSLPTINRSNLHNQWDIEEILGLKRHYIKDTPAPTLLFWITLGRASCHIVRTLQQPCGENLCSEEQSSATAISVCPLRRGLLR